MRGKLYAKNIVRSLIYIVTLLALSIGSFGVRFQVGGYFFAALTTALIVAMGYNILTMSERIFLLSIDELSSVELYKLVTEPFYEQKGYWKDDMIANERYVYTKWRNENDEVVRSFTIVKKDYIFDNDIIIFENLTDIHLISNSLYRGSIPLFVVINRDNIWNKFKTINKGDKYEIIEGNSGL